MSSWASMPDTHFSLKTRAVFVMMRMDSRTLNAMTGIITLSSSCPCSDAIATVVSRPITWKQTWLTISGMDGLILPGMIDDPGCTAGNLISSIPVRGPITMMRRSLAILLRSIASTRMAALKPATSPMLCMSWMRSCPTRRSRPVMARRFSTVSAGYSFSTVTPVPTALPPMPRSRR